MSFSPPDLWEDLDGLGAVKDLEPAPMTLVDCPRQLRLERPPAFGAHVPVVNGDPEPFGLDPHALNRRCAARERLAERPDHRLLGERLRMAEGDAWAIDDETVAAGVDGAGHVHALSDVAQVATG